MPVTIRQSAPEFKLNGSRGGELIQNVTLDSFKGKWVILLFYPMDWTFVCPTEVLSFNEAKSKFDAVNAEVVTISGDSPFCHLNWMQTPRDKGGLGGQIHLTMLSDVNRDVMKMYGVYNDQTPDTLDYCTSFRGLFVIDPKKHVRHIYVIDNGVGRNVDETIRVIKGLQFVDSNNGHEVCPANWHEGDKTFVPTAAGISKFLVQMK